ncbi:UNKNOWN [Stylonychia lemnae]|uniref:Uncharacterized protein n=1 Tax=Stylonychia lemnae TaxID=5949 RepID=A0A078AFW4_STYLE|nr:UNKNOWN [Stylonychia lemnae]|eukprot:CDW81175.1 UNKNOWN [Stylonychia lemnae]
MEWDTAATQHKLIQYAQQMAHFVLKTIRATGFRYNFNRPCYWKITTNNSISSSDFYKITIHFAFATAVRIYTGSALGVANNVVVGQTGYYYKFPIYDDNILTTIWIVANPDNQNIYDPDLLFSYEVGRDDDVQASVNIGIEPWQVGLLGVGLCVIALSVSCVIAKWVCKLGVPKYKPWEPNKDFYPKQEREAHKNSKGLVKNQDYETYRDNLQTITFSVIVQGKGNPAYLATSQIQTTQCFSGCLAKYVNAYYCVDLKLNTAYCCNSNQKTNKQNLLCQTSTSLNRSCSSDLSLAEMQIDYCTQNLTLCGATSYVATTEKQFLRAKGFYYDLETPCIYEITGLLTYETRNKYIEIQVQYMFACDIYLSNGTSLNLLTQKITAQTRTIYSFILKIGDFQNNKIFIAVHPDTISKVYPPEFNLSYQIQTTDGYLKYLSSYTNADYTDEILTPAVAIPFSIIAAILIGILGGYYSNRNCSKEKTFPEYLNAGEIPVDKRNWNLIELAMLRAKIDEPPKNAPKDFQLGYLEKLDEIKRYEKLDETQLTKAKQQLETQRYFDRKTMDVEELETQKDLDIDDQEKVIKHLENKLQSRSNKLNAFKSVTPKPFTTHSRFTPSEQKNVKLDMSNIRNASSSQGARKGGIIPIR